MPTVDSNGLPQFLGTDTAELDVLLNLVTSSVSSALDASLRPRLVANITERNALATAKPPTKEDPILVWRKDLGGFEMNSGTGWAAWPAVQDIPDLPGPNELIIDGKRYQASGSWSIGTLPAWGVNKNPWSTTFKGTMPFNIPSGWRVETFMLQTTGFTIAQTSGQGTNTVSIRVIQMHNNNRSATNRIGWRLVKQ